MMHGKPFRDLANYVEGKTGPLVPEKVQVVENLNLTNAIIGLVKRTLDGDELKKFKKQFKCKELNRTKKILCFKLWYRKLC
jgi:hypothetical protein